MVELNEAQAAQLDREVHDLIIIADGDPEGQRELAAGLDKIMSYSFGDLIATLFLYIEDFTDGYGASEFCHATTVALYQDSDDLITAVRERDFPSVIEALGYSEPLDVFLALLARANTFLIAREQLNAEGDGESRYTDSSE